MPSYPVGAMVCHTVFGGVGQVATVADSGIHLIRWDDDDQRPSYAMSKELRSASFCSLCEQWWDNYWDGEVHYLCLECRDA